MNDNNFIGYGMVQASLAIWIIGIILYLLADSSLAALAPFFTLIIGLTLYNEGR